MKKEINDLKQLPNIGDNLAEKLKLAGIKSAAELKSAGAEQAFIRLAAVDQDACLSKLFAMEGAIRGIRWHHLDKNRKEELKAHFRMVKKLDR
jgi:DNA transformation protein and related proteins